MKPRYKGAYRGPGYRVFKLLGGRFVFSIHRWLMTKLLLASLLVLLGCEQAQNTNVSVPPAAQKPPRVIANYTIIHHEQAKGKSWLCYIDESHPTDTVIFEEDRTLGSQFDATCTRFERRHDETISSH